MKVLITGGCGYIGTELIYALNSQSHIREIIVYDNLSRPNYNLFIGVNKLPGNKIKFIQGDILDSRKLKKILDQNIDLVYHLAAKVTTPFNDLQAQLYEQVNHWGSAELVYALEEKPAKKVIYLSSASVYGHSEVPVSKNMPTHPTSFYAISKKRGEEHFERLGEKMPVIIFRCANVYGYSKSMRFDAVINKFMFDANYLGKISIQGKGEQYRPFIHIHYLVSLLTACTTSFSATGIFDVVEKNLSIHEIADTLQILYPEMEKIYVNRHVNFRSLLVEKDKVIESYLPHTKSLQEELTQFKAAFTF